MFIVLLLTVSLTAVFFNRGSAVGSANGIQGFGGTTSAQ